MIRWWCIVYTQFQKLLKVEIVSARAEWQRCSLNVYCGVVPTVQCSMLVIPDNPTVISMEITEGNLQTLAGYLEKTMSPEPDVRKPGILQLNSWKFDTVWMRWFEGFEREQWYDDISVNLFNYTACPCTCSQTCEIFIILHFIIWNLKELKFCVVCLFLALFVCFLFCC